MHVLNFHISPQLLQLLTSVMAGQRLRQLRRQQHRRQNWQLPARRVNQRLMSLVGTPVWQPGSRRKLVLPAVLLLALLLLRAWLPLLGCFLCAA